MGLIVQKFGGSSVRDAERVMNVAQIVTDTYRAGNDVPTKICRFLCSAFSLF